jgi:hypothetical protein
MIFFSHPAQKILQSMSYCYNSKIVTCRTLIKATAFVDITGIAAIVSKTIRIGHKFCAQNIYSSLLHS